MTGTITLTNVQVRSGLVQNDTNAGAITTLNQSYVLQGAAVRNSSAGTLAMLQSTVDILGSVLKDNGATGLLTVNYSKIYGSAAIRLFNTNTGNTSVSNADIKGSSNIYNYGAAIINASRIYLDGASSVIISNGAGGSVNLTDAYLSGQSTINKLGGSTTGFITLTAGTKIGTNSSVQTNGTGNLTLTSSTLDGSSDINITAGDRNYTFVRLTQTGLSRANLSGTGAITDTFNELEMGYRGALNISCSGAANSMSQCTINGLSGAVTLSGTTGGKTMNRLKFFDGSLNVANNPNTGTYQLWNISDAGTVTISNHPAGQAVNYLTIATNGSISINKTGTGFIQGVHVRNGGNAQIGGTTTGVANLDVEQGLVQMSGGSVNNVSKKMSSTFTITGGAQVNVHHWNTANKTTSVNNTNRVDYLGVVSTAPIL